MPSPARKPRARKPGKTQAAKPAAKVAAEAPPAHSPEAPAPPPPGPGGSTSPSLPEPSRSLPELQPVAPMPVAAATAAKPIDYTMPRPNLLDTGLSDYSFWVSHVEGLSPEPLTPGERTGRIWA